MSWNRFNISIQLLRIVGLNIKVCILFIHWRLVSKTFCINAKFSQQQTKMLFSYKTLFSSQNKTFLCWTAAVVFTWYLEDSFSESEVSKMNWSGDFSFLVTAMERPDSTRVWHRKISFQKGGVKINAGNEGPRSFHNNGEGPTGTGHWPPKFKSTYCGSDNACSVYIADI